MFTVFLFEIDMRHDTGYVEAASQKLIHPDPVRIWPAFTTFPKD